MGTRGFVGFVAGGTEKIAYNHCDSYPSSLGVDVLTFLRGVEDVEQLADAARRLRAVNVETPPTAEDIEQLKPWTNLYVGEKSTDSWYCLLRETQGNPRAMLQAGVIEDASDFPADSLFAEWGYVIDTDAGAFEVYRGFQKEPHDKGRFASRETRDEVPGSKYYPVALVASWPLTALPTEDVFMSTVDPDEDE